MSAEEKEGRKSQVALEFIINYGWTILAILVAVAMLVYFGILFPCTFYPENSDYFNKNCSTNNPIPIVENITIDTNEELQEICDNLVIDGKPYDFLRIMGEGLKKVNNATDIVYSKPSLLISDIELFKTKNLIFCKVPVELCWTELNFVGLPNYRDGSYCMLWKLEVKVDFEEYLEWWNKNV